MKTKLNASNRLKKRYLLLEAKSKEDVENAILDYIGILGYSRASPQFIKDEKIILAIDRKELVNVRAAIELSDKGIKIIRVSGTIKGLLRK